MSGRFFDQDWIGVDFDGTLATYYPGQWPELGKPVEPMVKLVRGMLEVGCKVKIVTARVSPGDPNTDQQRQLIQEWCKEHLGQALPVQAHKDYTMLALFDNAAIRVEDNTGEICHGCRDQL